MFLFLFNSERCLILVASFIYRYLTFLSVSSYLPLRSPSPFLLSVTFVAVGRRRVIQFVSLQFPGDNRRGYFRRLYQVRRQGFLSLFPQLLSPFLDIGREILSKRITQADYFAVFFIFYRISESCRERNAP